MIDANDPKSSYDADTLMLLPYAQVEVIRAMVRGRLAEAKNHNVLFSGTIAQLQAVEEACSDALATVDTDKDKAAQAIDNLQRAHAFAGGIAAPTPAKAGAIAAIEEAMTRTRDLQTAADPQAEKDAK